jgi:hypothetical protein
MYAFFGEHLLFLIWSHEFQMKANFGLNYGAGSDMRDEFRVGIQGISLKLCCYLYKTLEQPPLPSVTSSTIRAFATLAPQVL